MASVILPLVVGYLTDEMVTMLRFVTFTFNIVISSEAYRHFSTTLIGQGATIVPNIKLNKLRDF